MRIRNWVLTLFLSALCLEMSGFSARAQENELTVFSSGEKEMVSRMLYDYLTSIAWKYLNEREAEIASINTAEQVVARQEQVRKSMLAALGPLPERTPLNAKVTGKFSRDGYRVEKVVYESRPHFYVTGTLYLPDKGEGPFPAVLGPCGHSIEGKAAVPYQKIYTSLARLGFVVLTYDPPGQGERLMYYDQDLGESVLGGATTEHTMAGIQCLLTGSNAAAYFIWDGMRGIDYLQSRPEVDPRRIAVTGNSGGGTLSAYISALDSRVSASVPSCYITSWRSLWETIGPQDAEQNLLPFIGAGLDFGDYVLACAPKPYLINTATRDFFPIRGARETYEEARRIYGLLGAEDKVSMFEADDEHGYSLPRREACCSWLGKHLLGLSGHLAEAPLVPEQERNLRVTPTGQVSTSFPNAGTIGSINAAFAASIEPQDPRITSIQGFERFRSKILEKVRQLTSLQREISKLNIQSRGVVSLGKMTVEKLSYDSEPGITLPALLFRPESPAPDAPAVLYAADWGKADDLSGDLASLVEQGYVVLAPDLRGKGETAREQASRWAESWFSRDYGLAMMAFQVNKCLVGLRAQDLIRAVDVMAELGLVEKGEIVALGKGSAGIPLLHAAAFDSRIGKIIVEGALVSWKSMVDAKYHRAQLDNVVLGALAAYDLPSLAACLAPRHLLLSSLTDPLGHVLTSEAVAQAYSLTAQCYQMLGKPSQFMVAVRQPGLSFGEAYGAVIAH